MNKNEQLNTLFMEFLSGGSLKEMVDEFQKHITPDDIDMMMEKIDSLGDPGDYCKNDYDSRTVSGFFLFIDFVSAMIIRLGDPAIRKIDNYACLPGKFVPWVIKYVKDARFHSELLSKFC